MMPTWAPDPDELPHLEALIRCVESGFRFLLMRDDDNRIVAVHAERRDHGAVDTIAVASLGQALAARTRLEDYPHGHPLWQTMGSVADVISELLKLPPHGSHGAPRIALSESLLWRPGDAV